MSSLVGKQARTHAVFSLGTLQAGPHNINAAYLDFTFPNLILEVPKSEDVPRGAQQKLVIAATVVTEVDQRQFEKGGSRSSSNLPSHRASGTNRIQIQLFLKTSI